MYSDSRHLTNIELRLLSQHYREYPIHPEHIHQDTRESENGHSSIVPESMNTNECHQGEHRSRGIFAILEPKRLKDFADIPIHRENTDAVWMGDVIQVERIGNTPLFIGCQKIWHTLFCGSRKLMVLEEDGELVTLLTVCWKSTIIP